MQYESNYIAHHGILGMKWGVRRYQNPDGSLTPKGEKRYNGQKNRELRKSIRKDYKEAYNRHRQDASNKSNAEYAKAENYAKKHHLDTDDYVFKEDRKHYLDNAGKNGIDEKTAKHVTTYSKMVDDADNKSEAYYDEAGKRALDEVYAKYGKDSVDSVRARDAAVSGAAAVTVMIGSLGLLTWAATRRPY